MSSKPPDSLNPLDPFGTLRTMRDANLDAWSKMMIELVNSDAYSQMMSKWADAYFTVSQPFQQLLNTTMTRVLTQLNMSTREDVTRLAERLTNIETLLDDLDARFDESQRNVNPSSTRDHSTKTKEKHS
jgi:uncharacterized protein YPO0396